MATTTLADVLDPLTRKGELYESFPDGSVRCYACAHRCLIHPGKRGICKVRFNQDGELRVPWGYVAGLNLDPIEKKPFFHVYPGSDALTFGMLGCDFHCNYCQNWVSSQALRDPASETSGNYIQRLSAEQLVQYAVRNRAGVIASSYNEPLITSEWAVAVFRQAKQYDIPCVYISNGNATPEALDYLRPHLVGYKIDLKTMQDKNYRKCGGVLQNVLDTIKRAHELGLWVEVVTLVIPGFNDSPEELWDAARFITSISPEIPWHVTAYHPDYKHDAPPTSIKHLQTAADIGQEAGLRYVYAGNIPGRVGSLEDTFCPKCNTCLVRRQGFTVFDYQVTAQGTCPSCGTLIPGVWTTNPESVIRYGTGLPRRI